MKKVIGLILVFMLSFFASAMAEDVLRPVRVVISDNNFISYVYDNLSFKNASDLDIVDLQSGQMFSGKSSDELLQIKIKDNKFEISTESSSMVFPVSDRLSLRSKSGNLIQIQGLSRAGKQAEYRGVFEIVKHKDNTKFYAINILELESYLRGVVPNEMPVRFGLEALKAQSVAARNYVIASKAKPGEEFDVSDSVASQVYFGAGSEKQLSDRAVRETNGIIALSQDDEPILALYSSTSGGYSENYENAFADTNTKEFPSPESKHYLVGKPDNGHYSILDSEEVIREFYSNSPDTFDNDSPYFRWNREWTLPELENVLKYSLKDMSVTGFVSPKLSSPDDFGNLKDIKILKRGVSGKVMFIQIITDKNIFVVSKELTIRRCFKKNGKALPSANFFIDRIDNDGAVSFKFIGGGYGHGVGMSQWGAGKMSSLGYRYDEILNHYYTGIRLTTCPVSLRTNGEEKTQYFYSELPNAWVYVHHDGSTDIVYVQINGELLEVDLKDKPNRVKADISLYIKKGINEIKYFTKNDFLSPSYIKVYTEIRGADNDYN